MLAEREIKQLDQEAIRLWELFRSNQHTALLNEVDALSKVGGLSAGVLGLASLSCSHLERYDQAANAASQALQSQPQWAWLFAALARAEAGQNRTEKAVFAQQQAVRLAPGEPGYMADLAGYQRLVGHHESAMRTARQALMVDPDHAGSLNELGLALLAAGATDEALSQFQRAQDVSANDAAGYMNEGGLHLRAGARGEAHRALREALRRQPDLHRAEDLMADSLAGDKGPVRLLLGHLLLLARVTMIGWLAIAFGYYLTFRLLQFIWRVAPVTLPIGQTLLLVTLVWLLGGLIVGRLLRLGFRLGWPR